MDLITAHFENGILIKTSPKLNSDQYNARYIISDGIRYDLESIDDVEKIPVPLFQPLKGMPNISHSLEYILRRKAGTLSKASLFKNSIALLRKSNQIMSYSPIQWGKKDYFYIVFQLIWTDHLEDAKKEIEFIEKNYRNCYDFSVIHKKCIDKLISNAALLNTDLVEADNPPNCSELCGKYRKRIYSLTGKDSRFPSMTEVILNSGLLFYPFLYGISTPKYCSLDEIITFNNRPFIDDRTEDEKTNYLKFNRMHILENNKASDLLEYCQIVKIFPDMAPKNFQDYQAMKFDNTPDFQELMEISEESRIDIELYSNN